MTTGIGQHKTHPRICRSPENHLGRVHGHALHASTILNEARPPFDGTGERALPRQGREQPRLDGEQMQAVRGNPEWKRAERDGASAVEDNAMSEGSPNSSVG